MELWGISLQSRAKPLTYTSKTGFLLKIYKHLSHTVLLLVGDELHIHI